MVVAYASLFGWVVTVDDLIGHYSTLLLAVSDNEWVILFIVMLILLIAGMFMDAITIMFICLPIFLPVAQKLGWDPIWFGVVVMINLAIGLFTPPVGINLYVAANITRLPLEKVARGALPFLMTSILGLAAVASAPEMSSFLINLLR
jgi:TRAP-type C4-dicarboxylate transport system, large permease component